MSRFSQAFANILNSRDELTLRNIRWKVLWPVILIFPLTVITGDLRYFDLHIRIFGFESYELMLFPLGLGWLAAALLPKRLILPAIRIAALCSAAILPFQIFTGPELARLQTFMALQFFNGLCAACAFSLFCFTLNNIERLFGMALIEFYYGFYYTVWRAFPAVQSAGKTWGGAVVMALYLVTAFASSGGQKTAGLADTEGDGKDSGVPFIIGLDFVYYIIMFMVNYIEWAEGWASSLLMGIGAFAGITLVLIIQVASSRSALYMWLLFLVCSMAGLSLMLSHTAPVISAGSFAYGLGDCLGYVIIYYICGGAIKRSASLKMWRLYCVMFFVEYCAVSGVLAKLFDLHGGPNHVLAFGVTMAMGCLCFILTPLMQRKLFDAPWTDGFNLADMPQYKQAMAETVQIEAENHISLTPRETEIFTLLLTEMSLKEIAYTLKITYSAVNFHTKNLYRKLPVQSRTELMARFGRAGA